MSSDKFTPNRTSSLSHPQRPVGLIYAGLFLGFALLSSGAAGLINQVVWQRSLKVFLGGSETISSMAVVLVFMAGLGIGSIWMGNRAAKLSNPLKTVGAIELLLGAVNILICLILSADLSRSVFGFQEVAISCGVPLLLIYALGAVMILVVPCLLMGATMPLAAEVCQRNLGLTHSRLLGLLFFINTFGSVAGTLLSSGYMISHLGLSWSLICAAGMNLVAGILLLIMTIVYQPRYSPPDALSAVTTPTRQKSIFKPSLEEVLALGLGFCSLGYEMYLFRLIPLRHQPLPFSFAAVLTGFLLFWSLGAGLSSYRKRITLSNALRICGLTSVLSITMFVLDPQTVMQDTLTLARFVLFKFVYFVPCFFFGYLFGLVASQAAQSWGRDIGRIYAWNTCGSCLGILIMTLIGYEIPFYVMVLVIGLLLFSMHEYLGALSIEKTVKRRPALPRWVYPLLGSVVAVCGSLALDLSGVIPSIRLYFGRDGVIGIDDQGNMLWDGLWHSALSSEGDHVGTNNWYLAVCPVFCHPTGEVKDACVIGVATGITASTLSKLDSVQTVDGYDINHTLKEIYRRYPEGTLNIASSPKINLIWQDARSGLALNPKKYDIIQTQPLYLKQAGSSLLNSVEFFQLISKRLKPGGVFCLYSNGTPEQGFVVRQTASQVFDHRISFFDGYLLICSNDPFQLSEAGLARRLAGQDPLWREIRQWHETADAAAIMEIADFPPLSWGDGRLIVTDDHPIVEYPAFLTSQVEKLGYQDTLPVPGQIY